MSELAKVTIAVPAGCKKTALSIDAMDKFTRDLAWKTPITMDGKTLLCRSFKLGEKDGKPVVFLEVMDECFEIIEQA